MKKSGEDRLKQAIYESTLSTADAVPLPQGGRLRYENAGFLASSKRIQDMWKKNNDERSLPRVGKVRAERAG